MWTTRGRNPALWALLIWLIPLALGRRARAEPPEQRSGAKLWTAADYDRYLVEAHHHVMEVMRAIWERPLGTAEALEALRQSCLREVIVGRARVADVPDWHRDGDLRDAALASYNWSFDALEGEVVELHALMSRADVSGRDFDRYEALTRSLREGAIAAEARVAAAAARFVALMPEDERPQRSGAAPEAPPSWVPQAASGSPLEQAVIDDFSRRYRAAMAADHAALLADVLPTLDAALWLGPENEDTRRQALIALSATRARIAARGPWRGDPSGYAAELAAADALIAVMERQGAVVTAVMADSRLFWWERIRFRRAVSEFDHALDLAASVAGTTWAPFDTRWGLSPGAAD